jgi:hypothetical protein
MTSAERQQFRQLRGRLGDGEASCLAIAAHRGWKIATDDKDARKWALRLHIPHTGTLGILGILVTQPIMSLTEGNAWLRGCSHPTHDRSRVSFTKEGAGYAYAQCVNNGRLALPSRKSVIK